MSASKLPVNPKEKFGNKKHQLQLVPPSHVVDTSVAMAEGAEKYGPYNWRESKVEIMTYISAILRHAFALLDGEWVDPESKYGKTHLAGISACCAIVTDSKLCGTLVDNRPKAGPAAKLLRMPGHPDRLELGTDPRIDCEGPFTMTSVERALELAGFTRPQADEVMRRLLDGPSPVVHSDIASAVLSVTDGAK